MRQNRGIPLNKQIASANPIQVLLLCDRETLREGVDELAML